MSTPELKPCPFCGKPPAIEEDEGFIRIECGNAACHVIAHTIYRDREEASLDWNTRHNPAESALNAARGAIKTELKFAEFEQRQRLRAALTQISPQQSKTT